MSGQQFIERALELIWQQRGEALQAERDYWQKCRNELAAERDAAVARVAELETRVEWEERDARQRLDGATAPCHGLGCGHCEDCVKAAIAEAAALRTALELGVELVRRLMVRPDELDAMDAALALFRIRAALATPGPSRALLGEVERLKDEVAKLNAAIAAATGGK